MIVSWSIMADYRRARHVVDLLGNPDMPQAVAVLNGGDAWQTGRMAWRARCRAADWHVVLQDDAIICAGFADRAMRVLAAEQDRIERGAKLGPVSFYLGTGRPRQNVVRRAIVRADRAGDSMIELPWLCWGVAVAMPRGVIDDALRVADHARGGYDTRLSALFERERVPTRYTWPSLVDHRDEESLVHGDVGVERRAHRFVDHVGTVRA